MPELIRNAGVQAALETWATRKDGQTFHAVIMRALTGDLLLDISASVFADPARPFQPGDRLAISSITDAEGRRLLLAFTDNERLAAATPGTPRSLGQPAEAVLAQAMKDFDGIAIDARHPGEFIAFRDELERALGEDPIRAARLARELAERRSPFGEFLALLAAAPVYVGYATGTDAADERVRGQVLTLNDPNGRPYGALFTSPAAAWAWGATLEVRATRLANLAQIALEDGQQGLVVDAATPRATIPLDRLAELAAGPRA